jgi:hypothetical protein
MKVQSPALFTVMSVMSSKVPRIRRLASRDDSLRAQAAASVPNCALSVASQRPRGKCPRLTSSRPLLAPHQQNTGAKASMLTAARRHVKHRVTQDRGRTGPRGGDERALRRDFGRADAELPGFGRLVWSGPVGLVRSCA